MIGQNAAQAEGSNQQKARRQEKTREREIRKGDFIETVSILLLIPLAYLIVKLWFVYEGFSIQW